MTIELIKDLKSALTTPLLNASEDTKKNISGILEDIAINCEKINEHGKRAESIIKNMLIHARTSVIDKEPLEINPLLD